MADVIDDLKVQIDASTNSADAKIDKFIQKMISLQSAISGIEMSGASQVASGINQIASSIQNYSDRTKTADFSRVTRGLNKLSAVDVQGVSNASRAMSTLAANLSSMGTVSYDSQGIIDLASSISKLGGKTVTQSVQNIPLLKDSLQSFIQTMNGLNSVTFDNSGLVSLVGSISKLGGKSAGNAIPNIQGLGIALKDMMTTLSGVPRVSNNLIQMTNALANLASNGSKVASASHAMKNGLDSYSRSAGRARLSTKGLVSQIGMFYARWFMVIRGMKGLWKATESSMDYIETLNYFDAAWGQVADAAVDNWGKSGYDSAEAYAKSFSKRAQELTGKMSGFTTDASGNLVSTGLPSLGIDPERLMNYQATFGQMASSMGVASETALQLSNALSMIGADLASVKNMKFEDVWQDMASGMVGMSRTLDKYGVNIRNVNLQEKLTELGIKTKITALNQQDKALLRTIILLDSTRYAWGDLATTLGQPSNQLRLLQSNFANLARTIGNLFLPIVAKVLPYINALVIAVQRLFSWIGGLLGIKIGDMGSSIGSAASDMDGLEDSAGGVADSMGDAADNAKKMAGNLQDFDDLNVVSSKDNSSSGGSGGGAGAGGGLLDEAFLNSFSEYQKAWDSAFSKMENSAQQMADKIQNAFQKIWEMAEPTRESLKRLWNEGLAQFGDFSIGTLKDFYEEFLKPVGSWTLGENGLARFFNITNDLLKEIDWSKLRASLSEFYKELGKITILTFTSLLDFYANFLKPAAKWTLGNGLPRLLDVMTGLSKKIKWDKFVDALNDVYKALSHLTIGIGNGLIGFIEGLAKVLTPTISGLISGVSWALKGLSGIISGIPEDVIIFLTGAISGFFAAFITYKTINTVIDTIKLAIIGFYTAFDDFFKAAGVWVAANPWFAIAAGLMAIAGGIMAMNQNWEKKKAEEFADFQSKIGSNTEDLNNAADALNDVAENSRKVIATAEADAKKVDILADSYFQLAEKTHLSEDEQRKLKDMAGKLVDAVPGLQGAIDMTTGRYTAQKDEVLKLIDAHQEYQKVLTYQSIMEDYNKALAEANVQLEVSEERYDTYNKKVQEMGDVYDDFAKRYSATGVSANKWLEENKGQLAEWGIEAGNGKDAARQLADMLGFYKQETENAADAQIEAKKAIEDGTIAHEAAARKLDEVTKNWKELDDATKDINFGEIAWNASKAIDDLGGVFVNGQQVIGEEAVKLYQSIIDAYGNTDQDMYNLGEKGVLQFGQGGKNGVSEAVGTMNDELWAKIKANYESKGYDVSYDGGTLLAKAIGDGGKAGATNTANTVTDAVTTSLQNGENTLKFTNSGIYGANKVLEGGRSLNSEMQSLGSGWASYSNDGLKQKFEELQRTSTPDILQNFAKTGLINPFAAAMGFNTSSNVFQGFGKNIVDGLNAGIKANENDSKGVIGTWVDKMKNWFTGLLDINSPSGLFADYGYFTVLGYNISIKDNMKSSIDLMKQWAGNISNAFDVSNVIVPDMGVQYSVNREFFDMVDTKASISYDTPSYDFKTGISAELNAALSGIVDYDRLSRTMAPILVEAMERADIKAHVGSDEVWQSTKDSWNRDYQKKKKAPVPV